jgi:polyhydroxybutyrate depolymerase
MKRTYIALLVFLTTWLSVGGQTNGNFVFDGQNRTYIVYVPSAHSAETPAPLMIVLHGFTQTAQMIMQYSNFNSYAEEHGFIVVYPNGLGNSWNVGQAGGSSANDVGFISALIDTIDYHYHVDLRRVYASGFSNGGFMSYRLACELNNRIAAVGAVAGTMNASTANNCKPGRSIPIIHIHGTSDFVVSYNGGFGNFSVNQLLGFWTTNNNCPETPEIIELPDLVQEGSTVEKHIYAPCDDDTELVHLKVINGGHTWPGAVSISGIGITNRDISASQEIWMFVSNFTNPLVASTPQTETGKNIIFPNPSSDRIFYLNGLNPTYPAEILVYTTKGTLVYELKILNPSPIQQLNLTHLNAGIFVLFTRQYQQSRQAKIVLM